MSLIWYSVLFLISDLLSASVIPPILLGLLPAFKFLNGFDVVVGGLGGILTVFIFGTIYYGNASDGAGVLLLKAGIYGSDWSTFGAFVAAPFGSLLWTAAAFAARAAFMIIRARSAGHPRPNIWQAREIDTARYAAEARETGVYNAEAEMAHAMDTSASTSSIQQTEEEDHKVATRL
jgi:hypothetical protein